MMIVVVVVMVVMIMTTTKTVMRAEGISSICCNLDPVFFNCVYQQTGLLITLAVQM